MLGHICLERKVVLGKKWVPKRTRDLMNAGDPKPVTPMVVVDDRVVTPETNVHVVASAQDWQVAKSTFKNSMARKVVMSGQRNGFVVLVEDEMSQ